jgi:hypothetical protein
VVHRNPFNIAQGINALLGENFAPAVFRRVFRASARNFNERIPYLLPS